MLMTPKAQKWRAPDGRSGIILIGKDYLPIKEARLFQDHLVNTNKSPGTVETYMYHLLHFFRFLDYKGTSIQKINEDAQEGAVLPAYEFFAEFLKLLRTPEKTGIAFGSKAPRRHSDSVCNTIINVVLQFYKFLRIRGIISFDLPFDAKDIKNYKPRGILGDMFYAKTKTIIENPVKVTVKKKQSRKYLRNEECKTFDESITEKRDKVIFHLVSKTAMRRGEILNLRWSDLVLEPPSADGINGWLVKITPRDDNPNRARVKNSKEGKLGIDGDLVNEIYDYILSLDEKALKSGYVFTSIRKNKGQPLSLNGLNAIFNRISKRCGVHVTPHMPRHTLLTNLAGIMGPAELQAIARHESPVTTLNEYVHIDPTSTSMREKVRKAVDFGS